MCKNILVRNNINLNQIIFSFKEEIIFLSLIKEIKTIFI